MNDQYVEKNEELQPESGENQNDTISPDVFSTTEIEIEEVAIDGICGVY